MLRWDKAEGVRYPGLARRRRAERALFLRQFDALEHLTPIERRRGRELDELRRTHQDLGRRQVLVRTLTRAVDRLERLPTTPARTARLRSLLARMRR